MIPTTFYCVHCQTPEACQVYCYYEARRFEMEEQDVVDVEFIGKPLPPENDMTEKDVSRILKKLMQH